ncbi:MAG TPA: putative lipid II flippase FtsW [Polyangiales bacterium]|jgi:cell division protein FtsW
MAKSERTSIAAPSKSQNVRVRRQASEPIDRKENRRTLPPPAAPKVWYVVGGVDPILAASVISLIAFGIVMVYSASSVWAHLRLKNDHALSIRQAIFAAVGVGLMYALSRIDYHRLRILTYPILLVALGLLGATAFGLGHEAGGASRWIQLGPERVQPAEGAKLAVILWLAYSLSKKTAHIRTFSVGFLPHVVGAGIVAALCLKQPDFGSAVMIGLILFLMLFTAGAHLGYLLGAGLVSLPIIYWLVTRTEYRWHRILAYLAKSESYQLHESWLSFGAGGTTGVGIGDSHQKLLFLPEAHTDFISAIIGEELGLLGFSVMVFVFLLVVYRGVLAALRAADEYGTYLAVGISLFIGSQAFTNLAVAVGLFPTKGLVLPFISYGGSSLLVNCCCVGILLNVSRARSSTSTQATERASAPARAIGGVA